MGTQVRLRQEYLLASGVHDQLTRRTAQGEAPGAEQAQLRTGGRKFPWPVAALGSVGGGAVELYFLLSAGEDTVPPTGVRIAAPKVPRVG